MDLTNRTNHDAGGGGTASVTRTRWGRRSPGGAFWLALLLIPLLFALLATCAGRGGIQDDLTARSMAALEAKGIKGADVSFDGRDGTLSLPADADAGAAQDAVAAVDGVRTVKVAGDGGDAAAGKDTDKDAGTDAQTASPYTLFASKGRVSVEALVPDEDARAGLLAAAKAGAGKAQVIDKITVKDGTVAPDLTNVTGVLGLLKGNPGTQAAWNGQELTLTGQVPSEGVKSSIEQAAMSLGEKSSSKFDLANLLTVGGAGAGGAGDDAVCGSLEKSLAAVQEKTKIQFAESSPRLAAGSQTAVREIAALLAKCADASVEVGGHTDNQGDPSTSKPLSQARARAVREALVGAGIEGSRITAKGYGEAKPIASNDTAAGRAANRRVEITVK